MIFEPIQGTIPQFSEAAQVEIEKHKMTLDHELRIKQLELKARGQEKIADIAWKEHRAFIMGQCFLAGTIAAVVIYLIKTIAGK